MNRLQTLDFGSNEVRTVLGEDGNYWWVLSDLAKILGYRDASNAGRILREKQKASLSTRLMSSNSSLMGDEGLRTDTIIVSEGGMYRLLMRSNHPAADEFQDWVTDEVLPQLREHGYYEIPMDERWTPELQDKEHRSQSAKAIEWRRRAEGIRISREIVAADTECTKEAILLAQEKRQLEKLQAQLKQEQEGGYAAPARRRRGR